MATTPLVSWRHVGLAAAVVAWQSSPDGGRATAASPARPLCLRGLLKIEDVMPTRDHDQLHVPAQHGQPGYQAPGLLHRGRTILITVDQQYGDLDTLRLIKC